MMVSPMRSQRMLKRAQALGELRMPATDMPEDLLNTSAAARPPFKPSSTSAISAFTVFRFISRFLRDLWRSLSRPKPNAPPS